MDTTLQQIAPVAIGDITAIANIHSGSLNLGPLTINWNLDISVPQIVADATIHGTSVGHVVINKANPTATLGGNTGLGEAEAVLTADFTKKQVDYQAVVKILGIKILDKNGVLLTW